MLTVQEYLKLPYNFIIKPVHDESGDYFHGSVLELEGCQSTGATFDEVYSNLQEAMEVWIETKIEHGFTVPEPISPEQFSGKFVVRIPKTLHYKLTLEAEREGVSLNQYALYKLSK